MTAYSRFKKSASTETLAEMEHLACEVLRTGKANEASLLQLCMSRGMSRAVASSFVLRTSEIVKREITEAITPQPYRRTP